MDGGIDLVGEYEELEVLVQCKAWKRPVNVSVLREFEGALQSLMTRPGFGMLISCESGFSTPAVDYAARSRHPMMLLTIANEDEMPKILNMVCNTKLASTTYFSVAQSSYGVKVLLDKNCNVMFSWRN